MTREGEMKGKRRANERQENGFQLLTTGTVTSLSMDFINPAAVYGSYT